MIALTAALAAIFTMTAKTARADELPGIAAQPASYFFTGKPHDVDLGAYIFNYRNYNAELNRWTSVDPSGFPDGPNCHVYAPVPTVQIDRDGLLLWDTKQATGIQWTPTLLGSSSYPGYVATYNEFSITANDGSTSLNIYEYVGGVPLAVNADPSYNCAGYVFGDSGYWINSIAEFSTPNLETILKAEGFKMTTNPADASIVSWGNDHIAMVTGKNATSVTDVTGKRGLEMGPTSGPLATQWSGTPTYWE